MPTYVRVRTYEEALAAPDADVVVVDAGTGELRAAEELQELSDTIVRIACSARPFGVRQVLDLNWIVHADYRGLRSLGARARLLERYPGGGLRVTGASANVQAIFLAGPWGTWYPAAARTTIDEAVLSLVPGA